MSVVRSVAGDTLLGGALIDSIYVTCRTLHSGMSPRKRKARPAMIEIHILPHTRIMAGTAICTELPFVDILRRVAGKTIGWCTFIDTVGMTGGACNAFVAPNQLEAGQAVIEIHIHPA